jgi:cyclopropane-fatty-acyl-phospholipid synthase
MWEFYLAGAEMAFRYQGQMVFQLQLTRRVDTLPTARDYMQPMAQVVPTRGREHAMDIRN